MPPSVRPDPPDGNYVVKKGRKVELRCVASGNPDPTITWTRVVSDAYKKRCASSANDTQGIHHDICKSRAVTEGDLMHLELTNLWPTPLPC